MVATTSLDEVEGAHGLEPVKSMDIWLRAMLLMRPRSTATAAWQLPGHEPVKTRLEKE